MIKSNLSFLKFSFKLGNFVAFLSLLLMSELAIAMPERFFVKTARNISTEKSFSSNSSLQLAQNTNDSQKRAEAEKIVQQAEELAQQKTKASSEEAIALYEEAARIYLDINDSERAVKILLNVAYIYSHLLKQYQQAIDVYNQALSIQKTQNDLTAQADTLSRIGHLYKFSGQYQQAIDTYNQQLEIQQSIGDLRSQAFTLGKISSIYKVYLRQPKQAIVVNQQRLNLYKKLLEKQEADGDLQSQLDTLILLGEVYNDLEEYQQAIDVYNQELKIQQSIGDLQSQAFTLRKISSIYKFDLQQPKQAIVVNQQRLNIYKKLLKQQADNDLDSQLDTLISLGEVYNDLEEYQKALDTFQQALKLRQRLDSSLSFSYDEASILSRMGRTYGYLGDREKLVDYYIQSFEIRLAKSNSLEDSVRTFNSMQDLYVRFGQNQKAIDVLERLLKLQQQNKDLTGEIETLGKIASIYSSMGEFQKALNTYDRARSLQNQEGNPATEAKILLQIAELYLLLGDYSLSIDTAKQALSLAQESGDLKLQSDVWSTIGQTYKDAKNYDGALAAYKQALSLIHSLPDEDLGFLDPGFRRDAAESSLQLSLGLLYEQMQDYPKALAAADRILKLSQNTGFPYEPAFSSLLKSKVYLAQKDYSKALEAASEAQQYFRHNPSIGAMEGSALNHMGKAYTGLKQYAKAIESYKSARIDMQKRGALLGESETLYLTAITERERGDLKAARTAIEAALNIVEELRGKVISSQLQSSYFASVQKYYEFYINLLMELHQKKPSQGFDALALQASERARARSLLDLLTESRAEIRQGVDPKLLEQIKTLQFQLDALQKRRIELYSQNSTQAQKVNPEQQNLEAQIPLEVEKAYLERERENLESQYRTLETQIRATSPKYAALTQPQTLTVEDLQQLLNEDTILLEYFLGEERSYLWLVSKTELASYELPKQAALEKLVKGFQTRVTNANLKPEQLTESGQTLSQILLGPVAKDLGQKRLLIVSNGALQYVPFAALPSPSASEVLLVKHEIITLPSASTLAILRQQSDKRQPRAKNIAIFADPVFSPTDPRVTQNKPSSTPKSLSHSPEPFSVETLRQNLQEDGFNFDRLPGTKEEASNILALVPDEREMKGLDFEASKKNILNYDLSKADLVHFATHGAINTVRPERSALVLSLLDERGEVQNGFLTLNDIYNLNLSAELVVLSACQTGLGQELKGEGLVGLTRGFMYAGSSRVIASLWNVNDLSTAELMSKMYEAMLNKNLPPAAALREAQLELLKSSRWSAPYHWAGFTLQGEWK